MPSSYDENRGTGLPEDRFCGRLAAFRPGIVAAGVRKIGENNPYKTLTPPPAPYRRSVAIGRGGSRHSFGPGCSAERLWQVGVAGELAAFKTTAMRSRRSTTPMPGAGRKEVPDGWHRSDGSADLRIQQLGCCCPGTELLPRPGWAKRRLPLFSDAAICCSRPPIAAGGSAGQDHLGARQGLPPHQRSKPGSVCQLRTGRRGPLKPARARRRMLRIVVSSGVAAAADGGPAGRRHESSRQSSRQASQLHRPRSAIDGSAELGETACLSSSRSPNAGNQTASGPRAISGERRSPDRPQTAAKTAASRWSRLQALLPAPRNTA